MAKPRNEKEVMRLLYQKQGSKLWGIILFYKFDKASEREVSPYRQSHPFVIADYTQGIENPMVFGSLAFLLTEIRRVIAEFGRLNESWWRARQKESAGATTETLDFEYQRHVMDFTVLLATYARNLFDVVGRLDAKTMAKLNYDNEVDGEIKLRELFDTLIHNRYYHFDGARIRDIFTSDPPAKRSLAGRFMGYGFDLEALGETVWDVVHEIELKDLTQVIRQQFKRLTVDSRPQDVVTLVQNVESLSKLLKTKTWSDEYAFMRLALFESAGLDQSDRSLMFQPPSIRIAPDLSRKEFDVHFRYGKASDSAVPDEDAIRRHHLHIGYVEFLTQINSIFGDKRLLSDFTAPKRHERAAPPLPLSSSK